MIVTTIKVKNLAAGPIAGLKVDEFWYDKAGEPVTGAQPFRYRKALMPGEVIDVVLRVPTNPKMDRNQYKFEHVERRDQDQAAAEDCRRGSPRHQKGRRHRRPLLYLAVVR